MSIESILEKTSDLFHETILGALREDFTFRTEQEAKLAIDRLISQLQSIDPLDLVIEDDDE